MAANVAGSNVALATATVASHRTMPSQNFTFAAWLRPLASNVAAAQTFLAVGSNVGPYGTNAFSLSLSSNLALSASVASSSNGLTQQVVSWASATCALASNAWAHVAAVQSVAGASNATLALYVNGALAAPAVSLALQALPFPEGPAGYSMSLGATLQGSNAFSGHIDDVRVYCRALLAADVVSLFNLYAQSSNTSSQVAVTSNPASLVATGLVSYLPFDGNVLDVASPGLSNVALTYGNVPYAGPAGASNLRFVCPSPVSYCASAMYLATASVGVGQQTHVDVALPTASLAGPLTVASWFMVPTIPSVPTSTIYNVGSAYGSNGLMLSLSGAGGSPRPWPPCGATITTASSSTTLPTATGTVTGQAYGNGTYVFKASTAYDIPNSKPENAFNKLATAGNYWQTASTGVYTGTANGVGNFYGDWLQIKLPAPVCLTAYSITYSYGATIYEPKAFNVYGSADEATWTLLDSRSGLVASSYTINTPLVFAVTGNTQGFQYYRIVVNSVVTGCINTLFDQWVLFDVPAQTLALAAAASPSSNAAIPMNPLANPRAATVLPGTWTHATVTYDTSNLRLYLNGDTTAPR